MTHAERTIFAKLVFKTTLRNAPDLHSIGGYSLAPPGIFPGQGGKKQSDIRANFLIFLIIIINIWFTSFLSSDYWNLNIYQICEPVLETPFLSIFGKRTLNKRNLAKVASCAASDNCFSISLIFLVL
jgi:hypothetical protein